MRLIPKFLLVIVSVSIVGLLFHFLSNRSDLDAVQNAPTKESPAYERIIAEAEKQSDMQVWPGTFQSLMEVKGRVLEYKMNLGADQSFIFTVASYADRGEFKQNRPEVVKKLSGSYRVKAHVLYFDKLQGHTGLMSDKARSAVRGWTQDGIEFKNEDSVMLMRRYVDAAKPAIAAGQ